MSLARTPTVYWDSCVWIGHIAQEPDKFRSTQNVIRRAAAGRVQIVTSTFTLAEVVRVKCCGDWNALPDVEDDPFSALLSQDYVMTVAADWEVGTKARELFRLFRGSGLKKPQDALHLATAVLENVDEMHTFDDDDLLRLNGKVRRANGTLLTICKPPEPDETDAQTGELFGEGRQATGAA